MKYNMIIIMLGAQGTGKGTVAGILSERTGWPQISTGDIFRKNIQEETELGVEANKYIAKGQLVPDEITVPMVKNRLDLDDAQNGAILDGFPRTMEQAQILDRILEENGKKVDLVINLTTPKDEIIERMINRRICSNSECKAIYNLKLHAPVKEGICDKCGATLVQREDDKSEDAINTRLDLYENQTKPLVDYYKEKGVLRTEEVSQKINRLGKDVAENVLETIEKK